MPTSLGQHKELGGRHYQEGNAPEFQEFREIGHRNVRLKELMFFVRIVLSGISTVIVSFFLLVLNLTPIWAFLFASLISLAIMSAVSNIIWFLGHWNELLQLHFGVVFIFSTLEKRSCIQLATF